MHLNGDAPVKAGEVNAAGGIYFYIKWAAHPRIDKNTSSRSVRECFCFEKSETKPSPWEETVPI